MQELGPNCHLKAVRRIVGATVITREVSPDRSCPCRHRERTEKAVGTGGTALLNCGRTIKRVTDVRIARGSAELMVDPSPGTLQSRRLKK